MSSLFPALRALRCFGNPLGSLSFLWAILLGARPAQGNDLRLAATRANVNQVEIHVSGAGGAGYVLLSSTDLLNWAPLSTNRPADSNLILSLEDHPSFYRAQRRG